MAARRFRILGIAIALLVSLAGIAGAPEDEAQAAAESWLALADRGDAAATWDQAAKSFQGAVTKDQWVQALTGVRSPLAKLQSRKLKSREYAENPPGAPPGKYVVLQYDAVFEKQAVVETVVPMLDADGVWRVSGYFVR